jgi:CHASE1-domain containing sensor protein
MNQFSMNQLFPVFMFLSVATVSLFSFIAVAAWSDARRKEREAFYRSETLRKITETQGAGATSALDFIREEEKNAVRRRREAFKLGGVITVAVAIGFMCFLGGVERSEPAYLIGLVPLFIGAVLLVHAHFFMPKV